MPFKSKAQARWMYANDPKMAKKWAAHTRDMKRLPDKKESREHMSLKEFFGVFNEDVDVKKMHEPEDFAPNAREFIAETNAQLKMLTHFAQEHVPGLIPALQQMEKAASKLEADLGKYEDQIEAAQAQQKQAAAAVGPGTAFKKI